MNALEELGKAVNELEQAQHAERCAKAQGARVKDGSEGEKYLAAQKRIPGLKRRVASLSRKVRKQRMAGTLPKRNQKGLHDGKEKESVCGQPAPDTSGAGQISSGVTTEEPGDKTSD